MITMKIYLISILLFMGLTNIVNAAEPSSFTTSVTSNQRVIAGDANATITVDVNDFNFRPVANANTELELIQTNGEDAHIERLDFVQNDNLYIFTLRSTDSQQDQEIRIIPKGIYNGTPWRFENKFILVDFKKSIDGNNTEIDVNNSSITSSPSIVTANGVSSSLITVILHDTENRIVTNATIAPQQGTGHSSISDVTNHNDGSYTFTVTSTTVETVNYSVNATSPINSATISDTTVNFTPITLGDATTVSATPLRVEADGIDTSVITMTLLDENDAPISNASVSLSADVDTSTISDLDTARKDEGIYTFTVSSSTIGDVTYTASYFDQVLDDKKVTVTYWNKADATKGSVVANPTEVVNNGTDTSTITVTVLDALDKPVTDANVSLAGNPSTSNISSVDNTQSASGVYVFTVSSEHKGAVVYAATATVKDSDGNDVDIVLDDTATVNYTNTNPDNMTITLTPSEQTTIVGVDASIVASVKIANTNVVQVGVTVSLDGGDIGSSTATTCVTTVDGTCTMSVHDEKAETVVYIPKANGTTPHESSTTASVTFTNPPNSSVVIALSPSEQNITVGIDANIVATVTRQGTNIPLKDVTVSLDGGDIGTSTATTCVTEADGTCTMIVNDTKVETIVYIPKANRETPHEESTTSSVAYTTGTSIKVISITPVSHTMQAGDTVTMSIQTQDSLGNAKDPSNLDLIAPVGDINLSSCVKIELGKHTCEVTSTVTGTYTLTTNITDAAEQLDASLIVTPSSGTFVTLTANPEDTQEVGYDVTVTMTLKDDYDNLKDVAGAEANITSEPSNATLTGGHESLGIYTYALYDEKTETVTVETNVAGAEEDKSVSIVFTPGELDEETTRYVTISSANEHTKKTFSDYASGIFLRDRFNNDIPFSILEGNGHIIELECNTTRDDISTLSLPRSEIRNALKVTSVYSTRKATISCQYLYDGETFKEPFNYDVDYLGLVARTRFDQNGTDNPFVNGNIGTQLGNVDGTHVVELKIYDDNVEKGEEINIQSNEITIKFTDLNHPDELEPVVVSDIEFNDSIVNYIRFNAYNDTVSNNPRLEAKITIDGIQIIY